MQPHHRVKRCLSLSAHSPIDTLQERGSYSYCHSIGEKSWEKGQTNLLQGTLDLLILKQSEIASFTGLESLGGSNKLRMEHFA